jgi:hypothetical protein
MSQDLVLVLNQMRTSSVVVRIDCNIVDFNRKIDLLFTV